MLAAENGAAAAPEATLLKGASAMLARYMDESRAIPTATSFRTLTVTTLDSRRKQLKEAGHRVSFTHLIAFAIARAATEQMPVMARSFTEIDGKPHVVDAGAVNLGIAVDVERKDGGRTLMVPVIRDAGRLSFPEFLDAFNDLITRARDNSLTADDLQGANVSLTNPGGIGTIASVPRLMSGQGTIVATGAIGYPAGHGAIGAQIGAEKVMTMTSTYDHRIIQGAESGQFLQVVEQYLQGEHGFYDQVFSDLGVALAAAPAPPAPEAAPPRRRPRQHAVVEEAPPSEQLLQAVQAATSLIKAHRTHGHLAAKLDPLGSEPEGDPALDPEPLGLTEEIMHQIPSKILRTYVPGATLADALPHLRDTYCGTIAYEIEHIASHRQRMWLREKIESGAFRAPMSHDEKRKLLRRLTQVDSLGPRAIPALDPEPLGLTEDIMRQIPSKILRTYVPGATLYEALPQLRRDLLRHDRLRNRAHRLAPPAHVAAREDRVRRVPRPALLQDERRKLLRRLARRSTRSSALCTRPTWARSSSRSRAWT